MNPVVHFELPAADLQRAKKFYEEVFAWNIDEHDKGYFLAFTTPTKDWKSITPGAINGGLMKKNTKVPSPLIVIDVPSIDKHLSQIQKAGGGVVIPKTSIGDIGYSAYFKDTEGNIVGLFEKR